MAGLAFRNVCKSFGDVEVLRDIDLEVVDKEFVVFVGPSGCGKSTLLRMIAGLEDATSGHIEIDGKDVTHMHPVQRGVSMVFQSYALYPHLTVFENIAFPLRVAKASEAAVKSQVHEAAEILQLTDRLDFKPGQLSGGQRQRVAIGRSIVRKPGVFLFDEPLSNLDAALRGDMRVELASLHQRLNITMIYVTHDQTEAMTMADRIVVMSEGVVEQHGTPMELYHNPRNKFVAGFIGYPKINFLPGTCIKVEASSVEAELPDVGRMTFPVEPVDVISGQELVVGVRPEDVELVDGGDSALSMQVKVVERLGSNTLVYGEVSGRQRFCAILPGDARVQVGDTVKLAINPDASHVFSTNDLAQRRRVQPAVQ